MPRPGLCHHNQRQMPCAQSGYGGCSHPASESEAGPSEPCARHPEHTPRISFAFGRIATTGECKVLLTFDQPSYPNLQQLSGLYHQRSYQLSMVETEGGAMVFLLPRTVLLSLMEWCTSWWILGMIRCMVGTLTFLRTASLHSILIQRSEGLISRGQ
uniref:Uncharacterized protein n=1 Tax=Arundo donax TaxID=35708 RepID=A0A0A9BXA8_ARUDO